MQDWLTTPDLLADLASILAALAAIGTAEFVFSQTRLQAQAQQFHNARRNVFGEGRYKEAFDAYSSDDKGRARSILSVYGLLARMSDHDAIDEDVARGDWKTALYRDWDWDWDRDWKWDRLENVVSGDWLRTGNGNLFVATEQMVDRWKKADAL